MRKVTSVVLALLLLPAVALFGQSEKKALKNAERHVGFEEWGLAIPHLEEAVGINPQNAQSRFWLGKCYYLTYRKKKAEEQLRKAYELNPEVSNELNYYYAHSLHYVLKFDEAIVAYKKAQANFRVKDPEYGKVLRAIKNCEYAKEMVKNPVDAKIVNVGGTINTPWSEHSPVISADESMMIFTSRRPGNMGSSKDNSWHDEDVYITFKDDNGKWTKPENLRKPVNSEDHDATIALSPDGQRMFIYKDPPGNGDIFETNLEGEEWTKPKSLGSPVNTKNYETTVSISSDGRRLFFASDRDGGLGDLDIYMSTLEENGKWSEPKNLGQQINTPFSDDSPFIHPNGRTLYFSSDGRPAIGGYDIYKTELQEDGSWSPPQNMGYPINTPDDDIYFVLSASGVNGFYASAKEGGYGEKDIYQIIMPQPKVVAVVEEDTVEEAKPVIVENPLTILKGMVTDAFTGDPVGASIKVIDNAQNQVISEFKANSSTGKYLVSLPSGKNYGIQVDAEDYLFHSENFDIPSTKGYQEIVKDIELKKIKVGESIVLRNIFFDHDKSTLRDESVAELQRLLDLLNAQPNMRIEISGHTDNVGSDSYNQRLSQDRAHAVVDYLVEKGIPTARMEYKGYGESTPIDKNDTPEGRQNNRRTEFKILQN